MNTNSATSSPGGLCLRTPKLRSSPSRTDQTPERGNPRAEECESTRTATGLERDSGSYQFRRRHVVSEETSVVAHQFSSSAAQGPPGAPPSTAPSLLYEDVLLTSTEPRRFCAREGHHGHPCGTLSQNVSEGGWPATVRSRLGLLGLDADLLDHAMLGSLGKLSETALLKYLHALSQHLIGTQKITSDSGPIMVTLNQWLEFADSYGRGDCDGDCGKDACFLSASEVTGLWIVIAALELGHRADDGSYCPKGPDLKPDGLRKDLLQQRGGRENDWEDLENTSTVLLEEVPYDDFEDPMAMKLDLRFLALMLTIQLKRQWTASRAQPLQKLIRASSTDTLYPAASVGGVLGLGSSGLGTSQMQTSSYLHSGSGSGGYGGAAVSPRGSPKLHCLGHPHPMVVPLLHGLVSPRGVLSLAHSKSHQRHLNQTVGDSLKEFVLANLSLLLRAVCLSFLEDPISVTEEELEILGRLWTPRTEMPLAKLILTTCVPGAELGDRGACSAGSSTADSRSSAPSSAPLKKLEFPLPASVLKAWIRRNLYCDERQHSFASRPLNPFVQNLSPSLLTTNGGLLTAAATASAHRRSPSCIYETDFTSVEYLRKDTVMRLPPACPLSQLKQKNASGEKSVNRRPTSRSSSSDSSPLLDVVPIMSLRMPQAIQRHAHISDCSDSIIYLLHPVRFLRVHNCKDCTIVVGAVSCVLSVSHCQNITVQGNARAVKLENSYEVKLYIYTHAPPVLLGDCRGTMLAPSNVVLSRLNELLRITALGPSPKFVTAWANPIVVSKTARARSGVALSATQILGASTGPASLSSTSQAGNLPSQFGGAGGDFGTPTSTLGQTAAFGGSQTLGHNYNPGGKEDGISNTYFLVQPDDFHLFVVPEFPSTSEIDVKNTAIPDPAALLPSTPSVDLILPQVYSSAVTCRQARVYQSLTQLRLVMQSLQPDAGKVLTGLLHSQFADWLAKQGKLRELMDLSKLDMNDKGFLGAANSAFPSSAMRNENSGLANLQAMKLTLQQQQQQQQQQQSQQQGSPVSDHRQEQQQHVIGRSVEQSTTVQQSEHS